MIYVRTGAAQAKPWARTEGLREGYKHGPRLPPSFATVCTRASFCSPSYKSQKFLQRGSRRAVGEEHAGVSVRTRIHLG